MSIRSDTAGGNGLMIIKITTDSTGDLAPAELDKYDIDLFSLEVILGGKAYKDGVDIFSKDVINGVERDGLCCSTASVSVGEYLERFGDYSERYDAVIHISIGDKFSSCYRNALIASEDYENVYVVNSHHLSSGQGALALYAAELAKAGTAPEEIFRILNETAKKVRFSFIIDGLDYLRRGGRCSTISAIGANLLSIKPCIETKDGVLEVGKKYRGPMEKCVREYIKDQLSLKPDFDRHRVILVYLGISKVTIDSTLELIRSYRNIEEILCCEAGCTIASHCGPGTLGLFILDK